MADADAEAPPSEVAEGEEGSLIVGGEEGDVEGEEGGAAGGARR